MAKKKMTQKQQTARIKQLVEKQTIFESRKLSAIEAAEKKKGKKLTKKEVRKAVRNIKSGMTREERKELTETMQEFYKDYSKAHKQAEKIYGKRVSEKANLKEFKEILKSEISMSDSLKKVRKDISDIEEFRELSDYSYRTKYENFKANLEKVKEKERQGLPLNDTERLMLDYKLPKTRGRMPIGAIISLVNYFDELGLSNIVFDSPGED